MFAPNEEQSLLAESVSKFIDRRYPDEARMTMGEAPLNDEIWGEIAEQGWLMLPFPEDFGGLRNGGETGAADMATLFEALGPGLLIEPLIASGILAGGLVSESPRAAEFSDQIAEIASGATIATAALHEPRARHDLFYCETTASKTDEGWRLNGAKSLALGGPKANLIVVLARAEGNPGDGAAGLG